MQDDEATSLSDLIEDSALPGPAQQVEQLEILEVLSSAVNRIPERERLLLSLYYREELTMKEISRIMNVSESRVCQLHMQAILRLRSALHLHQENEGMNAAQRQPAAVSKRKGAMHSTNR